MLSSEQEFFFKDFFIILSALFGLMILIFIQLKNLGFRFRPLGRRAEDIEKYVNSISRHDDIDLIYDKNWGYSQTSFKISLEDEYAVWHISIFIIQKINLKNKLKNLRGHFWYEFSNSQIKTEKIMAPIFRKIVNRYKSRFDSEKSIQFITKKCEDHCLYSWLKNETHLHAAIYNFLDECIYITNELNVKPTLLITVSDYITFEISIPPHELILQFENELKELYAVDFFVDKEIVKITLCVAFSENKIPDTCIDSYSKLKILPEEKAS